LEKDGFSGPWVLPMVQFERKRYIVDLRLRQFREFNNPHNYVDFDTEQGKHMCEQAGVVVCKACQMSVLVSAATLTDDMRCPNCLASIRPKVRV